MLHQITTEIDEEDIHDNQNEKPVILLYNPKVALPGYQRLPHSLLQLGGMLEGRYAYAIVDGNLDQERDRAAEIIEQVRRDGVRYLGVTIMPGPQLQQAVPDIKRIKAACPDLIVIVGGYFPTNHVNTCSRDPMIDYVVLSAGEDTLLELLDTLEAGGDPATVAGLAFERDGKVIQTPRRLPRDPNEQPWFPYAKVPVDRYVSKTHLGTRTLSHHSSFGCPFFCNFCAVVNMVEGRWLAEKAERLGELMQYFVDNWQINAMEFHDNNFFVSEKRVAAFCEDLLRRGLKINWWGEGRIDTMLKFSPRTWALMRDSGLKMVFMGAESGDDHTLELMNKGGTPDRREDAGDGRARAQVRYRARVQLHPGQPARLARRRRCAGSSSSARSRRSTRMSRSSCIATTRCRWRARCGRARSTAASASRRRSTSGSTRTGSACSCAAPPISPGSRRTTAR